MLRTDDGHWLAPAVNKAYNYHMSRSPYSAIPASEIPAALAKELGSAQFALLFGSFGTPYFTDSSDVDVAVRPRERLDVSSRLALTAALEAVIGRDVDLLDLMAADPIVSLQVLRSGRVLVMNDPEAFRRFVARVLSEYPDLKLDRRPIEERLAKGGGR